MSGHSPSSETRMSLGAHLEELRARLILAVAGFVPAFVISLAAARWFIRVVLSPYETAMKSAGMNVHLQALHPAEPLLVYLKGALVLGALLSAPWVIGQLWAFVAAGLHPQERRLVRRAAPLCGVLFAGGALFFLAGIAPWMFRFLMRFDLGLDYLTYQPGLGRTIDFLLVLALVFGVAFQTPLAMVLAERAGLVSAAAMARARKYVLLGAFVAGAVFTPPDVFSQVALAVPLYLLYEMGLWACRIRRPKGG